MEAQMKLDSDRIRVLSENRGWSQDQLASAAGVSLRTVQRAEGDGIASRETKVCLAAALGIPHMELAARNPDVPPAGHSGRAVNVPALVHTTIGTSFLMVGLGFLGTSVFLAYSPIMVYLGSLFALCGAVDLVFAWFARRSPEYSARSIG